MVINNINAISNLYAANAVIATKQSKNASRVNKSRSFQDEMRISKEAQNFNDMLKKLQNESDIRQDKVDEYSRQIAAGSYDVKSENIAASILANQF